MPVPTMIAVGVASPRAQGQAMISMATATRVAKVNAGAGPNASQKTKAASVITMIVGTKMAATWSASRWIGAFDPWASSTSLIIWASTVSGPTLVARKVNEPVWFRVAP